MRDAEKARRKLVEKNLLQAQAEELVWAALSERTLEQMKAAKVAVPSQDDTPVDLRYNLLLPEEGSDAAAAPAGGGRRGSVTKAGTKRPPGEVCWYCARGGVDASGKSWRPVRAMHRLVHCPRRKKDGAREFSAPTLAELGNELRNEAATLKLVVDEHAAVVASAKLARRQSYRIGGACRMLTNLRKRQAMRGEEDAAPPPPPAADGTPKFLMSELFKAQRLARHWWPSFIFEIYTSEYVIFFS